MLLLAMAVLATVLPPPTFATLTPTPTAALLPPWWMTTVVALLPTVMPMAPMPTMAAALQVV